MTSVSTTSERSQPTGERRSQLFGSSDWFDPIETALREQVRGFIEQLIRNELDAVLARPVMAARRGGGRRGRRRRPSAWKPVAVAHGHVWPDRDRSAAGPLADRQRRHDGVEERGVARLSAPDPGGRCIDCGLLSGRRQHATGIQALAALFDGAVGKDIVSRTWRRVQGEWQAWNIRSLANQPIVRLTLTAPWSGCGSTTTQPRSRYWSSSASETMVRRSCSRSRAWVARAPRLGARYSMISSIAGCRGPRLSLSTALRGSSTPLPPSGMGCWCNAVRCTNTGTCSLTPPNGCATRSPTITTTCSTQGRRPRSKRAARASSASGGSNIARWPTIGGSRCAPVHLHALPAMSMACSAHYQRHRTTA